MKYDTIILPFAKQDIKEVFLKYKSIRKNLGDTFILSIKKEVKIISKNPFSYQIKYKNVRVGLIETFPYLIHFSVYGSIIVINYLKTNGSNGNIYRRTRNDWKFVEDVFDGNGETLDITKVFDIDIETGNLKWTPISNSTKKTTYLLDLTNVDDVKKLETFLSHTQRNINIESLVNSEEYYNEFKKICKIYS